MLLDRATEERIMDLLRSLGSAYSVFAIGRELGQTLAQAAASAVGITTAHRLTFLEQSYLAGKIANAIGPDQLRDMTLDELARWIRDSNIQLDVLDRANLNQLNRETQTWLTNRTGEWQKKYRTAMAEADRQWRKNLATTPVREARAFTTSRNAALRNLKDRLGNVNAGMQGEVNKLAQSQMNHYFQQGFVAGESGEEWVYKVPRATACETCMRLHLDKSGKPRRYRLRDVMGNSNIGASAANAQFTIGPVHPYCYCVLYFEKQKPREANAGLAQARQQILKKALQEREEAQRLRKSLLPDLEAELPLHIQILVKAIQKVHSN